MSGAMLVVPAAPGIDVYPGTTFHLLAEVGAPAAWKPVVYSSA